LLNIRIIPRLDIKAPNLIKGVHLEGLRVIGDPQVFAKDYYENFADELLYIDVVATLYGRNNLREILRNTARDVFIPITVGGGVRSTDDVRGLLRSGADKIALNTAAVKNPRLISELAKAFGSQCVVVSVEAKEIAPQQWEVLTDNGREKTGLDVVEWVRKAQSLGAGEVLLTSVDREGTRSGFDLDLVKAVSSIIEVPMIVSGGMGKLQHFAEVCSCKGVTGVAVADVLHYNKITLNELRIFAMNQNINVRHPLQMEIKYE
jgi:cyclase